MNEIKTTTEHTAEGHTMTFEGRQHTFENEADAKWVHEQLCRAHRFGIEATQRRMMEVMGLDSWSANVQASKLGKLP